MNTNGKTVMWITIIISILITSGSISYGVIQASARAEIIQVKEQVNGHEIIVNELVIQNAVVKNELKHINKKLDQLLKEK